MITCTYESDKSIHNRNGDKDKYFLYVNANHSDDGVLAEVRSPKIMGDSEGLGVCFRFYLTTVGSRTFILQSEGCSIKLVEAEFLFKNRKYGSSIQQTPDENTK